MLLSVPMCVCRPVSLYLDCPALLICPLMSLCTHLEKGQRSCCHRSLRGPVWLNTVCTPALSAPSAAFLTLSLLICGRPRPPPALWTENVIPRSAINTPAAPHLNQLRLGSGASMPVDAADQGQENPADLRAGTLFFPNRRSLRQPTPTLGGLK